MERYRIAAVEVESWGGDVLGTQAMPERDGDWVKYKDVERLQEENTRFVENLKRLHLTAPNTEEHSLDMESMQAKGEERDTEIERLREELAKAMKVVEAAKTYYYGQCRVDSARPNAELLEQAIDALEEE